MLKETHSLQEAEEFVKKFPVVIAGFYSPHCEVCKELAPLFKQSAEAYPQYGFLRVNILEERNAPIIEKFGVESPTLMIFKDGKEYKRFEVEKYGKEKVEQEVKAFFGSLQ